jgi:hypothetical protein
MGRVARQNGILIAAQAASNEARLESSEPAPQTISTIVNCQFAKRSLKIRIRRSFAKGIIVLTWEHLVLNAFWRGRILRFASHYPL